MYTVVVAVDIDEDRARTQAEAVSNLPCAAAVVEATLLHSFTGYTGGASVHQVAAIRRAKEGLESAGVTVTLAETSGDPAASILETAEELDADLICVAGRRRSPAKKVVLGSVTQEVIQHADRPVLVCGTDQ